MPRKTETERIAERKALQIKLEAMEGQIEMLKKELAEAKGLKGDPEFAATLTTRIVALEKKLIDTEKKAATIPLPDGNKAAITDKPEQVEVKKSLPEKKEGKGWGTIL